ncbi:MAG: pilus assembly protein TadE [Dehalococcoidia bacterium]|nr:MAG: pilus assembly protein TadE [Dehalococcoidia bacterium]
MPPPRCGRRGSVVARKRWLRKHIHQIEDESGQALVEAALAIPVLLLLVFGVVAVGRVTEGKVAVQAAARESARALAVAPSEEQGVIDALAAAEAVAAGYGLDGGQLTIKVDSGGFARGATVTSEVRYSVSLSDLPLLGFLDVDVSASHSERTDIYRSREVAAQ